MNADGRKREGNQMPVIDSSIPALLLRRAVEQPDATAFTYIDYGHDPAGFAETLTWGAVARRARILADELALCGSPGDRVAIGASGPGVRRRLLRGATGGFH